MSIFKTIKSWFSQECPETRPTHYQLDQNYEARRWKSLTDLTEFHGMTEQEVDDMIPLELKINMVGNLGVPEAISWYKHFKVNGVWPTTEEAYFMRYLKGNHRNIPFNRLRKFIMEDAGDDVNKEIKLWSHR